MEQLLLLTKICSCCGIEFVPDFKNESNLCDNCLADLDNEINLENASFEFYLYNGDEDNVLSMWEMQ